MVRKLSEISRMHAYTNSRPTPRKPNARMTISQSASRDEISESPLLAQGPMTDKGVDKKDLLNSMTTCTSCGTAFFDPTCKDSRQDDLTLAITDESNVHGYSSSNLNRTQLPAILRADKESAKDLGVARQPDPKKGRNLSVTKTHLRSPNAVKFLANR